MTPGEKFQQVLKDNNLYVSLAPQRTRKIEDGSLIIENPQLLVDWITPPVEEPAQQLTPEAPAEVAHAQAIAAASSEAPVEPVAPVEAAPVEPTEGGTPSEPTTTA